MLTKSKLPLLFLKNIRTCCKADTKENVIRSVGQMLVDFGYVKQSYVEGMLLREKTFSTYMGNGLALPHGVEEAKREILESGIAVMIFPDGTDWDGEVAKVVIGIAGVGEEHLEILSVIAEQMLEEENVEHLINGTVEEVYEALKGGE